MTTAPPRQQLASPRRWRGVGRVPLCAPRARLRERANPRQAHRRGLVSSLPPRFRVWGRDARRAARDRRGIQSVARGGVLDLGPLASSVDRSLRRTSSARDAGTRREVRTRGEAGSGEESEVGRPLAAPEARGRVVRREWGVGGAQETPSIASADAGRVQAPRSGRDPVVGEAASPKARGGALEGDKTRAGDEATSTGGHGSACGRRAGGRAEERESRREGAKRRRGGGTAAGDAWGMRPAARPASRSSVAGGAAKCARARGARACAKQKKKREKEREHRYKGSKDEASAERCVSGARGPEQSWERCDGAGTERAAGGETARRALDAAFSNARKERGSRGDGRQRKAKRRTRRT